MKRRLNLFKETGLWKVLGLQAFVVALVTIFVSQCYVRIQNDRALEKTKQIFTAWQAQIGQEIFINNIVKEFDLKELHSVEKFEKYLAINGVHAAISVTPCSTAKPSANSNVFPIVVGDQPISSCLRVEIKNEYFGDLGWLFVAILCFSLLLNLPAWVILSRRIELAAKGEIASEVAHNINTPLRVLRGEVATLKAELTFEKWALLDGVSEKISNIVNELNFSEFSRREGNAIFLDLLLEKVVAEKKAEVLFLNKKVEINFDRKRSDYGLFVQIDPSLLEVTLSNIINNSIEAIGADGRVEITARASEAGVGLDVHDTGKGISREHLSKVFDKGFTFGKANGQGSGLYQAKTKLPEFGAKVSIDSRLGQGTHVRLSLKSAAKPKWFATELDFSDVSEVVVVDDEKNGFDLWSEKLKGLSIHATHVSNRDELSRFLAGHSNSTGVFFIFDHEFKGQPVTGLDLIEEFKLKNVLLATNKLAGMNPALRCEKLGIKLLPKSLIPFVPITRTPHSEAMSFYFLEDEFFFARSVEQRMAQQQIPGRVYKLPEELLENLPKDAEKSVFFLDYQSEGSPLTGADVARRLYGLGFRKIFLYSAHSTQKLRELAKGNLGFISGFLAKSEPGTFVQEAVALGGVLARPADLSTRETLSTKARLDAIGHKYSDLQ